MKKLIIFLSSFIFIASCGGGGGGGSSADGPTQSNPDPVISSFSSSDSSITVGTSITLSWSSVNATSCSASGDWSGAISVNDSKEIILDQIKVYNFTLTCVGASGTIDAVSSVSVDVKAVQSPVINSFVSSASTIKVNESITLTWTTSATTVCDAKGDWEGSKTLNGSEILQLDSIRTYTFVLECTGIQEQEVLVI